MKPYKTITDGDVTYEPWTDGYAVGFKCTHTDGRVEFVYLNPSNTECEGNPDVFLYQGPKGDPGEDSPIVFVNVLPAPAPKFRTEAELYAALQDAATSRKVFENSDEEEDKKS